VVDDEWAPVKTRAPSAPLLLSLIPAAFGWKPSRPGGGI
jgi:hypothetical protein